MLRLNDSWIWDSWYAFDGDRHHGFYLRASRGLGDPDRRHRHPSVGHAISDDLTQWTVVADALAISEPTAFDDYTTWTGSVVRGDDGTWYMFYTGTTHADGGDVQKIGVATSPDLMVWTKPSTEALLRSDPRWYESLDLSLWHDEAWRDPFVFKGEDGLWHMYITARVNSGPPPGRGVVGRASSSDLCTWAIESPLTEPGAGFGQMEVVQVEVVDDTPTMVFSCGTSELDDLGLAKYGAGGVFSVTGPSLLGPFDAREARRFPHDSVYAGRLVQHGSDWYMLGFRNIENGHFVGELCDPIRVSAVPGVGLVGKPL